MIQSKTRQQLIEMYLQSLEEEKIPWHYGWDRQRNYNPITKTVYRGINQLMLEAVAMMKEYDDPRWCSFTVIADKDGKYHPNEQWHLKKGSKAALVELWKVKELETGKYIDFEEYHKIVQEDAEKAVNYQLQVHCYPVFNYSCIEGCPPLSKKKTEVRDEFLQQFCENAMNEMKVNVTFMGNAAFYRPSNDSIVLPLPETFHSTYDFYATWLHEAGHATGHTDRLNRDMTHFFGTEGYAKEELRAEIGSSFLCSALQIPSSDTNLNQHKAYIQGWIEILKKNPDELFRAIADAKEIEAYLLEKGHYEKLMENAAKQELLRQIPLTLEQHEKELSEAAYLYCLQNVEVIQDKILKGSAVKSDYSEEACWKGIQETLKESSFVCIQNRYLLSEKNQTNEKELSL